jgi:VanZ family protein
MRAAAELEAAIPAAPAISPPPVVPPTELGPATATGGVATGADGERRPRRLDGERVAVIVTAAAVALLPLAMPQGPSNTAPIDVLVGAAFGACLLWAVRAGVRCRFPYAAPMLMMLAGGAMGALVGPVPTLGIIALVQDLMLIAWCWAVVNISHSAANLKILLAAWAYAGIAWAIVAFVGLATGSTLLTGQIERQGSRVQITLADPSYAANYFFMSIMIIWATQRPRRRGVRILAYVLLVAAIATTGSNSGLVGLTTGTLVATVLGAYRRFGAAPALTLLVCALLSAATLSKTVSLSDIQSRAADSSWPFLRDGIGRSTQSSGQREALLSESIHLYERGNVVGEGPVSTKPRLSRENVLLVKEAHNDYFAALIERGPVGFIGILLLVSGLLVRAVSASTRRLSAGFADVVVRPNALVGALIGTLLAMTVYELLHVRHVWAMFAIVAAVSLWGQRRS